jgi:hypothetical protein
MLLNMESVYHIVTICVNKTSCAHVWRLRSCYLKTGYDRNHLSKGMQIAALRHTEMVRELAMLWAVVSSIMELMLGCLPDEAGSAMLMA